MTDRAVIVGHLVLFVTTIMGFLFQWLREARQHRWHREAMSDLKKKIENGNGV